MIAMSMQLSVFRMLEEPSRLCLQFVRKRAVIEPGSGGNMQSNKIC